MYSFLIQLAGPLSESVEGRKQQNEKPMVLQNASGTDRDFHSQQWVTHAGINFLRRAPRGIAFS